MEVQHNFFNHQYFFLNIIFFWGAWWIKYYASTPLILHSTYNIQYYRYFFNNGIFLVRFFHNIIYSWGGVFIFLSSFLMNTERWKFNTRYIYSLSVQIQITTTSNKRATEQLRTNELPKCRQWSASYERRFYWRWPWPLSVGTIHPSAVSTHHQHLPG